MTLDPPSSGDGGRFVDGGASGAAVADPTEPSAPSRFLDAVPVPASLPPVATLAPVMPSLPLDAEQLERLCSLLKLLSDKTRLSIIQLLCGDEMNVTALCRKLKLPQPTVSHHLGLLRMNRLIANRRDGKEVYYRLHERIEPAQSHADGAALDERPSGLQIEESGYTLELSAQRAPSRGAIFPRTEKR